MIFLEVVGSGLIHKQVKNLLKQFKVWQLVLATRENEHRRLERLRIAEAAIPLDTHLHVGIHTLVARRVIFKMNNSL